MSCPDFSPEFVLQCDASAFGVGAVLSKKFEDGEKPVCFISRSLSRAERNYSTTEQGCLAVIWGGREVEALFRGCSVHGYYRPL